MSDHKKSVRLGLVIAAAIMVGFGAVAALSRGFEYVIAADIHPMLTEPLDTQKIQPEAAKKVISRAGTRSAGAVSGKVLGEYTTKFSAEPKSRNSNISHAAGAIRGAVVEPGEVFSYNDTVGPTTKENGYKRARIYVSGKKAYGYGGGVCQVSSTLFNAAESAGMEIIERHSHSLPVGYVPKGKDAATSYGGVDFKFKNTLAYPVKIDTGIAHNALTIQILAAG